MSILPEKTIDYSHTKFELTERKLKSETDDLEPYNKNTYRTSRRSTPCFARLFFWHGWPLIDSVKKNKGELRSDMIEDSTEKEGEAQEMVDRFERNLEFRRKGEEMVTVVNRAIWRTYRTTFLKLIALSILAESLAIFNAFYIGQIIKFIVDKDLSTAIGV